MNRMREIREQLGIKQGRIAMVAGVSQSEISRIERSGITPRSPLKRARIAKALQSAVAFVFPDPVGTTLGDPLPPRRRLFKSSDYELYPPQRSGGEGEPSAAEPVKMTRTICRWCGIKYSPEREVKIMLGDVVIKTYGHLSCLEQDVRTDGLELKKRGRPL